MRGGGEIEIAGERFPLDDNHIARVSPGTKRKVWPGPDGIRLVVLGGVPGAAYEAPDITKLGEPDPMAGELGTRSGLGCSCASRPASGSDPPGCSGARRSGVASAAEQPGPPCRRRDRRRLRRRRRSPRRNRRRRLHRRRRRPHRRAGRRRRRRAQRRRRSSPARSTATSSPPAAWPACCRAPK